MERRHRHIVVSFSTNTYLLSRKPFLLKVVDKIAFFVVYSLQMNKLIVISFALFFLTVSTGLNAKTPPPEITDCTTSVQSIFNGTLQASPTATTKYNLENWTEKNENGGYTINQQEAAATITAVVNVLSAGCNLPSLKAVSRSADITAHNKKGVTTKELDFIEVSGQKGDSIVSFKAYSTGKLVLGRIPTVRGFGKNLVANKDIMTVDKLDVAIIEALPPELKIITEENMVLSCLSGKPR